MPGNRPLPAGKLPPRLLSALLQSYRPQKSSGVVVGPRVGEDAAVLDIGREYLVATSDPVTFTAHRIGWYAVNVNANDVAMLGARPRWFLATVLLPGDRATAALARVIFRDIIRACRALGITLCGGHTEITSALKRPVVAGQMLALVSKSRLVVKESQRPGDLVVLTKGIALEGTAILARERGAELVGTVGGATVRRAQRLLFHPGISVVREAQLALRHGEVHALHDPTEGGLLAGLAELARAGNVGLRIWKDRVPILTETTQFSDILGFDPMALIASGALLAVVSAKTVRSVLGAFARHHVPAAVIGEVCRWKDGVTIIEHGRERPLRIPDRDEIARMLERC